MKNLSKYILPILFTIIVIACEKEIEFDQKLIAPKLVVNGFFENDSLIDVKVSASKVIKGFDTPFTWLDDATVTLFVDDEEVETLKAYTIDYPEIDYSNYWVDNSLSQPTTGYRSQKTVGEIGKTYKLVISHPDYESATVENYLPENADVIFIESEEGIEANDYDDYSNRVLNVKLKFKDKANEKNYYRLLVRANTGKWRPNWRIDDDTIGVIEVSTFYPGNLLQNDLILNPDEEGANDFLFGSPSNRYSVFTDEFIDGKEHELKFSFRLNNSVWYNGEELSSEEHEGEFYNYHISLQAITRETYLYLLSSNANRWYSDDYFSEPAQVFTNVENGLGIFGGYTSTNHTISKGEYPIDGIEYEENNYVYFY